jgi:hypothetical protein
MCRAYVWCWRDTGYSTTARAHDRVELDAAGERRRKVRTPPVINDPLEPALLNPLRNRVWLQYLSHKLGRLIVPYAMALLFVANVVVASAGVLYMAALGAQLGFYGLALYGAWLERQTGERPRRPAPVAVRAE